MDRSHSLSTPMIMRSLDMNDDSFWSQSKDEEILGDETPYLSAIRALLHLANNTRSNIYFAVNLVARFSSSPTKITLKWCWAHAWTSSKDHSYGFILFRRIQDRLIDYADAEYLSAPHKAQSQIWYLFTCGGTVISWWLLKLILVITSSNHAKIKIFDGSSWECVWLKSMVHHIQKNIWFFFEIFFTNHNVWR